MAITRRILLAGAAALSAAPADSNPVRLPKRLRIGILGTEGHVGEITDPLGRLPDVQIAAVSGENSRAVAQLAKKTSARIFAGLRPMLDAETLDVVAINNNNGQRAGAILECLRRGLNVIAEKPLALTTEDLTAIRKLVAAGKGRIGMLLPMRFEPVYLAMRDIVREGSLGEIAQIAAQKSYKAGARDPWFLKRATYGGTIAWIGIHMIDLMRFTSGRDMVGVAGIQGHVGFPELGEMENVTVSIFRLDNGGVGTLRMDYLRSPQAETHGDDRLRLAGTRGILEWNQATGLTLMTTEKAPVRIDRLPAAGSVFIDYLEHVYNGKPTALPLADIWRVNEITIAAQRAADAPSLSSV